MVADRPFYLRRFAGRTTLLIGLTVVGLMLLAALAAPLIAPYDPVFQDGTARLVAPSAAHPFGTDNFGRDVLSRVIWAARVDLQIAFLGVVFPFVIGTTIGTVSGYFGGVVDAVFMRIVDVVLAFPYLVLIIAIIAILGPGLKSFYIALALVGWVSYARLIRSQVLILKNADFVLAARSLGYSHSRIMFRHLLPNALISSIVFAMSDMVLVLLGGLRSVFLGLGCSRRLRNGASWLPKGRGSSRRRFG